MSANLIIPTHEGLPLDEARVIFFGDTHYLPHSELKLKFPTFMEGDPFLDHPNVHNKTQKREFYPRNKLYNGAVNNDSNFTDGHAECRNKDLFENMVLPSVKIDLKITEKLITKKVTSQKLNAYPKSFMTPRPGQFSSWKQNRDTNLILETNYQATNVNRGRAPISHNPEMTIGKLVISYHAPKNDSFKVS